MGIFYRNFFFIRPLCGPISEPHLVLDCHFKRALSQEPVSLDPRKPFSHLPGSPATINFWLVPLPKQKSPGRRQHKLSAISAQK